MPDYFTDIKKHYVRQFGWLAAAHQLSARAGKSGIKYLTFCALEAIDVFHFDLHEILKVDEKTGKHLHVYYCEYEPEIFEEISHFLDGRNGFFGDFTRIVLFEDDEETLGRTLFDPEAMYPAPLRERLRLKDAAERLKRSFPFDLLNLDLSGSLFGYRNIERRLPEALRRVIELQTSPPNGKPKNLFTILLTTRIEGRRFSVPVMKRLSKLVDSNRQSSVPFREAYESKFGPSASSELANLALIDFCCVAVPKLLIEEGAEHGWKISV